SCRLGVLTAANTSSAITPKNTHSILERSQYVISNQVIRQNMSASLVPVAYFGKEHFFEIVFAVNKAVARRVFAINVKKWSSADQLVGNDAEGLLVMGQFGFLDGAVPDAACELRNGRLRLAFIEHLALVDDGHLGAEIHHIFHDVGGEDDDHLLADFGQQIVKTIAFAGIEAGGGLVDNQQLWVSDERLGNAKA